jgi:hypothetical protein
MQDQIDELERIAKRDARAVLEIHAMFAQRYGWTEPMDSDETARRMDRIHRKLADHAAAVERERRQANRKGG